MSLIHRSSTFIVGTLLALGLTSGAFAHAHLQTAVPPQNGTTTATPDALRLRFSEGLEVAFTGLTLTGPNQIAVPTGVPTLAPGDNTTLVVPIQKPLGAGVYSVAWHALSRDGHKTNGTYTFTVKP